MRIAREESVQARSEEVGEDRVSSEEQFTPMSRLSAVASVGSPAYVKEFRLKLLHRMLMRGTPIDEVARQMEVSVATVLRDRAELFKRLKKAAQKLDIDHIIGDTIGFYGEITSLSLRLATISKQSAPNRLAAMRTALAAKNDASRFLETAGVLDVLKYKQKDSGSGNDLEKMAALIEAALSDGEDIPDIPALGSDDEDDDDMVII
jgi:hypothetical protein